jgi:hypothetical protein
MLGYVILHRAELVSWEVRGVGERDRLEPELRERAVALNVDVRRFVAFVTEEEEPVGTDAKDRRQAR